MDDAPPEEEAEAAPIKAEEEESNGAQAQESMSGSEGSGAIRPIFLGNLMPNYSVEDVTRIFEHPGELNLNEETRSFPVDRIDVKRGFCFVFLKDAKSQASIDEIETFLRLINGM